MISLSGLQQAHFSDMFQIMPVQDLQLTYNSQLLLSYATWYNKCGGVHHGKNTRR